MTPYNEKTPATPSVTPVQAPAAPTAAPQVPVKDPATTAPTAAKGDDDVMSQQPKKS